MSEAADKLWFLGEVTEDDETLIGTVAIMVTFLGNDHEWLVEELNGERKTRISYDADSQMLFDGEFVYTEDFMVIVGMLDEAEESGTGKVVFVGDEMFK